MALWSMLPLDHLPELVKAGGILAVGHIDYPAGIEVNDNGLVYVPLLDGELVYADVLYALEGNWQVAPLQNRMCMSFMVSQPTISKSDTARIVIDFSRQTTYVAKRCV